MQQRRRQNNRKRFCKFTAEGVTHIDYKDLDTLKQNVGETGKVYTHFHVREDNQTLSF